MYRIGIGYDIHRLAKRRKLFLGGIQIPYHKGLLGHSDADVLLHAVCDALLGACAAGDIGRRFPDTHLAYKNISSIELLKKADAVLKRRRFSIRNIDSCITAEEPKLEPFKKQMGKKIAAVLGLAPGQVSVKATSHEGLGPIGQGRAIAAYAVTLLCKQNQGTKSVKRKVQN